MWRRRKGSGNREPARLVDSSGHLRNLLSSIRAAVVQRTSADCDAAVEFRKGFPQCLGDLSAQQDSRLESQRKMTVTRCFKPLRPWLCAEKGAVDMCISIQQLPVITAT